MRNRFFVILFAVVFVFMACGLVGCEWFKEKAKEEAKDQVDTSFKKDVEFELEPINATGGTQTQTLDMDCGKTTVKEELEKNDVSEDDVDINSISLQFVEAKYSEATWMPVEVTHMACVMTLWDSDNSVTIMDMDVDKSSAEWTPIEVSADAAHFINYYLENRTEEFNYCVECSDADSYSVTWEVKIGVTVKGELN
jgi:hypothetical protein